MKKKKFKKIGKTIEKHMGALEKLWGTKAFKSIKKKIESAEYDDKIPKLTSKEKAAAKVFLSRSSEIIRSLKQALKIM